MDSSVNTELHIRVETLVMPLKYLEWYYCNSRVLTMGHRAMACCGTFSSISLLKQEHNRSDTLFRLHTATRKVSRKKIQLN